MKSSFDSPRVWAGITMNLRPLLCQCGLIDMERHSASTSTSYSDSFTFTINGLASISSAIQTGRTNTHIAAVIDFFSWPWIVLRWASNAVVKPMSSRGISANTTKTIDPVRVTIMLVSQIHVFQHFSYIKIPVASSAISIKMKVSPPIASRYTPTLGVS